jgi:hypothetical protein
LPERIAFGSPAGSLTVCRPHTNIEIEDTYLNFCRTDSGVCPGQSGHCHPAEAVGYDDRYRLRVGDYRVIYEVVNGQLVILVVGVGHRREIYRAMS